MLRNLLYSLFFHIVFIALLVLSTMDFSRETPTTQATPLTISFLNENSLEEIKDIKAKKENESVKDLTIEEKIDLYNKVKNLENLKQKGIYEKSDKKQKKSSEKTISLNSSEENEFEYYYTPIYVAENKINTEEKRKLIENRIKREELRKKMKEKNIVPKVDVASIKQIQKLEDVIKISQKPLVVKKKDKKEEVKDNIKLNDKQELLASNDISTNKQNEVIEDKNDSLVEENTYEESLNVDEVITSIAISSNQIDQKFENVKSDEIFNSEDIKKLKEIDENKADTKYMLSLREKINIQRQIKGCYKMAILRSKKDSKAIVGLTVNVAKDGIIDMHNIKVNKIVDNFNTEGFDTALENAKSALVFCSPLRGLPSGKYKTWRYMTFIFDSNNLD